MGLILGVDFGTSIAKGTALSANGEIICQVKRNSGSEPARSHTVVVWDFLLDIVRELRAADQKEEVDCLAVTATVPNVILIDEATGTPVADELMFYDQRAYDIEQQLDRTLNSKPWANEVLSKIIWIQRKCKGWSRKQLRYFSTHSYVVWRATGVYCLDPVTASECGTLFDSETGKWNRSIIGKYSLNNIVWPQIVPACTIVGSPVDKRLARLVGKTADIVVGTSDSISTCVGAGLRSKGDRLIYYGTFNSATNLLLDMDRCLSTYVQHPPFDWWCSVPRSGQQLQAIAELLFAAANTDISLSQFDGAAGESRPGANGLIFLHNENPSRTTVSTEPKATIAGLGVHHTKADIARAVMESFAYLLRWNAQRAQLDLKGRVAYCGGGGAASALWRQIVSDVTGVSQSYLPQADRGLGSALLALRGLSRTQFEAARRRNKARAIITRPSRIDSDLYEKAFQRYVSCLQQQCVA